MECLIAQFSSFLLKADATDWDSTIIQPIPQDYNPKNPCKRAAVNLRETYKRVQNNQSTGVARVLWIAKGHY